MLGIDVTVSQTEHIMNIIEQAIPETPYIHLLNLQHPDLAIVDLKVGEDSPVNGVAMGDIDLPDDCIIAAVLRGPDLIIPADTTELRSRRRRDRDHAHRSGRRPAAPPRSD